jgi:hypothetical protein
VAANNLIKMMKHLINVPLARPCNEPIQFTVASSVPILAHRKTACIGCREQRKTPRMTSW